MGRGRVAPLGAIARSVRGLLSGEVVDTALPTAPRHQALDAHDCRSAVPATSPIKSWSRRQILRCYVSTGRVVTGESRVTDVRGVDAQSQTLQSRGEPEGVRRVWRRRSESNRRRRLCRPLHDHSATPPGVPAAFQTRPIKRKGRAATDRQGLSLEKLERETSLELATSTLARLRSTN